MTISPPSHTANPQPACSASNNDEPSTPVRVSVSTTRPNPHVARLSAALRRIFSLRADFLRTGDCSGCGEIASVAQLQPSRSSLINVRGRHDGSAPRAAGIAHPDSTDFRSFATCRAFESRSSVGGSPDRGRSEIENRHSQLSSRAGTLSLGASTVCEEDDGPRAVTVTTGSSLHDRQMSDTGLSAVWRARSAQYPWRERYDSDRCVRRRRQLVGRASSPRPPKIIAKHKRLVRVYLANHQWKSVTAKVLVNAYLFYVAWLFIRECDIWYDWFRYLTCWGWTFDMIYFTYTLHLDLKSRFMGPDSVSDLAAKFAQAFSELTFATQVVITLLFWFYIYPQELWRPIYWEINMHGCGLFLMIFDYLYRFAGFQLRNLNYVYGFAAIYTVLHVTIVLLSGEPIYPGVDFRNVFSFVVLLSGLATMVMTHKIFYLLHNWSRLREEWKTILGISRFILLPRNDSMDVLLTTTADYHVEPRLLRGAVDTWTAFGTATASSVAAAELLSPFAQSYWRRIYAHVAATSLVYSKQTSELPTPSPAFCRSATSEPFHRGTAEAIGGPDAHAVLAGKAYMVTPARRPEAPTKRDDQPSARGTGSTCPFITSDFGRAAERRLWPTADRDNNEYSPPSGRVHTPSARFQSSSTSPAEAHTDASRSGGPCSRGRRLFRKSRQSASFTVATTAAKKSAGEIPTSKSPAARNPCAQLFPLRRTAATSAGLPLEWPCRNGVRNGVARSVRVRLFAGRSRSEERRGNPHDAPSRLQDSAARCRSQSQGAFSLSAAIITSTDELSCQTAIPRHQPSVLLHYPNCVRGGSPASEGLSDRGHLDGNDGGAHGFGANSHPPSAPSLLSGRVRETLGTAAMVHRERPSTWLTVWSPAVPGFYPGLSASAKKFGMTTGPSITLGETSPSQLSSNSGRDLSSP